MRTHTTKRRGGFALAGVAAVALMGGSAFTASNSVQEHTAGHSSVAVTGLTSTQVSYDLTAQMDKVEAIEFTAAEVTTGMTGLLGLSGTAPSYDCAPLEDVGTKVLRCSLTDTPELNTITSLELIVTKGMTTAV